MARGKKKESALTPEEKLAQALVHDWEQPYKVPGNWKWIILGNLVEIRRGASPRPIKAYVTEDETGINWIKIGDTDSGKYITHVAEKITSDGAKKSVFVEEGTLLLSNSMSFGRPYILKVNGCIHDGWLAITPSTAFNKEYLYYALLASEWYFEQVAVGTAVRNLNSDRVSGTPVPCPPLAEQQRIVDRIEYLFAKLDEAKEKAQSVLDSFETRKAAILHQAFTGELTTKWREEHVVGMDSWYNTSLAQVVSGFKYGTSEKSDYNNTGMPVLRIPNIGDGCVDFSDIKYLNHSAVDEESQIHEGDILIIRSNGSRDLVGKSVLVPKLDRPHAYASFLIRIKPSSIVKSDYLTSYLNSADARSQMFRKAKSSAGINNINSKELGAISLTLPSIPEQMEIVRILDSLFAKEQQAKEAAEAVLEKIDLLKKSILARAFRGELGTNDPSEESALELLKQVLQEDTPTVTRKRSNSIPKDLKEKLNTELERSIIKLYFKTESDTLPVNELLSVSSKKFEIMNTLRLLEQRKILTKLPNGKYRLLE